MYACAHLSNSASLLLPVSNLTNLLALQAGGVSFTRFAVLMGPAWLLTIGIEYLVFRRFFAADLAAGATTTADWPRVPVFALTVLLLTLVEFVGTSLAGLDPQWAAWAGALVLTVRALRRGETTVRGAIGAAGPLFCLFVLALGVVVQAVLAGGLQDALTQVLPTGTSLPALLGIAAVAAVLANLINNLPAVLALLPIASAGGTGPRARRADRRQPGPQPHLRRLPGDPAVAAHSAPSCAGHRLRPGGVHPSGAADRTGDRGGRDGGDVDDAEGHRKLRSTGSREAAEAEGRRDAWGAGTRGAAVATACRGGGPQD
ncbi:hypothetical protein SANTM175S_09999 [Streptomyces antimycoticus]